MESHRLTDFGCLIGSLFFIMEVIFATDAQIDLDPSFVGMTNTRTGFDNNIAPVYGG